jgi:hypothetical protein
MSESKRGFHPLVWAAVAEIGLVVASIFVWGMLDDPFGMVRYVLRLLIAIPIALALAVGGVRVFDELTPPVKWIEKVAENEIACAVVLSSLILGVFWLCVQG